MSIFKQQVDSTPNFVSLFNVMEDNSSVFFSSNNIYFAQKEPLKGKFLRPPSAQVKLCQIPLVNFETTCRFLSKFCITLQCHER